MNEIFQAVDADVLVSITDLKRNAATVVKASQDRAVGILNHNRVVAYLISPAVWEYVQELHDDAKIVEMLEAQKDEVGISVDINDL